MATANSYPTTMSQAAQDARVKPTQENQNHEDSPIPNTSPTHNPTKSLQPPNLPPSPSKPILYFMTLHFLLAFCELILIAPLIKLLEQSLCIAYYAHHDPRAFDPAVGAIPEPMCKIPDVQVPLATIRGWKAMLDTIPVLLVAVPFGRLADRYGRKKLMAVCLLGLLGSYCEVFVVCAFPRVFPLQLVLLSPILLLLGGGLPSAVSLMWAMASESIPEDRRSHDFYFIFAAFYVAELVGSFTAATTTEISPWISCGLSILSIIACLLLLLGTPDAEKSTCSSPVDSAVSAGEDTTLLSAGTRSQNHPVKGLRTALLQRKMLLTLPVFLTGSLRFTILNVLVQYASNRFSLKISAGALFYTETAIVNILLFLLLVPTFTSYIRERYDVQPQVMDLFMARTCVFLLALGSLLMGLSPSSEVLPVGVFVFASGFGSRVSALSLVSRWISDDTKATLYAAIAVLENLGHAIGDPSLQQIFAATLRLRFPAFWQALPFFVASGLYCLAVVSTLFIGSNQHEEISLEVG